MNNITSPEQVIDGALKKACLVVFIVSSPAFFISLYRNIYLDFLPLHVMIISTIWIGFFFLSSKFVTSPPFRFYSLAVAFLILFFVTGYRNQSLIMADMWLIIIGGLLALRQSQWAILSLAVAATAGLYLIIDEQFLFPGMSFELHVGLHTSALLISFVLYSAIRNIVSNFQSLYEIQVGANNSLVEKNKRSYLLVQEAEENKEDEKRKLRNAAYNLYSQVSTLQNIIKFAEETSDRKILKDTRARMEDIKIDLLEFSKSGKYISSEATKLTFPDLVHIIENHIRPYSKVSSDTLDLSVSSTEVDTVEFAFPIHLLKLLSHHLIQHCIEDYQAKELKFDLQKGIKARNMQEIKLSLYIYSTNDLSEFDFSKLNREMESKSTLSRESNHISFIKTLLRSMSGSLEASSMGKAARYELSFWID